MPRKAFIQLNDAGVCFHEFEYSCAAEPAVGTGLMDVTARNDGPFLGKEYDPESDTFSYPPTAALEASEESIKRGGSVKLAWETRHATAAEIDQGVGAVAPVAGGTRDVSPRETKTYKLTATGAAGTTPATASVTVEVT